MAEQVKINFDIKERLDSKTGNKCIEIYAEYKIHKKYRYMRYASLHEIDKSFVWTNLVTNAPTTILNKNLEETIELVKDEIIQIIQEHNSAYRFVK